MLAGVNSQNVLLGLPTAVGPLPNAGSQQSQSYKRIVNIYSVHNQKPKRKSIAPEGRLHLNHSVIPYEDIAKRGSSESLQLPELANQRQISSYQQHVGSISYQGLSHINRGYPYRSPMDHSNSAMIAKLMARKRSYERMMHIDDNLSANQRSPLSHLSDIHSRKNQEILLSANRPMPLSRITKIEGSSAVKKNLNYYGQPADSESRKIMKSRLMQPNPLNAQTLDVTGQRVVGSDKPLRTYKSNANLMLENA